MSLTSLADILAASEKICAPAGGVTASFTVNSSHVSSTNGAPINPTSFTGEATVTRFSVLSYVLGVATWFVWIMCCRC